MASLISGFCLFGLKAVITGCNYILLLAGSTTDTQMNDG
jgi:hypothetical protein